MRQVSQKIETFGGSDYFRLVEAADGVYAAICKAGSGSLGNAAIVDLGDATLVVDTTYHLEAARDLRSAAEHLTGRSVTYVLNTHWHADHVHGNQVFAPDAILIATDKTREIMAGFLTERMAKHRAESESLLAAIDEFERDIDSEPDEKIRLDMREETLCDRSYIRMLPELRVTLPTLTFERELWLHGSKRSVQLLSFGGGHTQSDAIVYVPDARLAIVGDLVLKDFHPTMSHAEPWEWLRILDRVEALGIDSIVPGHGEVCSLETLHGVREYIQYMLGLAVELDPDDEQLDGVTIPEKYDDWRFRFDFKGNLKKIRSLLAQKGSVGSPS